MSAHSQTSDRRRQTSVSLKARKGAEKIVVLTAYTAPVARILDPLVDILLVGDSVGMVLYGMETTLPVSLDMMIAHGRAVVNASKLALVVVDMPFASYQASEAQALLSCARVFSETGCGAVKLEGAAEMAPTIRFLVERGIPVMGHVGLKPQHVHATGGYRAQGRTVEERERVISDALAVQEAGAFSIVLESIPESLGREITRRLSIPTIGIGASPACDGQVLVIDDMLGMNERVPRFVKVYASLGKAIGEAAERYAREVRDGIFPAKEHCLSEPPKKPAKLLKKR